MRQSSAARGSQRRAPRALRQLHHLPLAARARGPRLLRAKLPHTLAHSHSPMKILTLAAAALIDSVLGLPEGCAIYDTCGKKSVFGAALPCNNRTTPQTPTADSAALLQRICGADFDTTRVCCLATQIAALQLNLKKVDPLISSCPACKRNFYDFFCQFLCLPHQAAFTNVTKTAVALDTGLEVVTEISSYVDPAYAEQFFQLCKNLKFSATNGFAMDLIGGGAKTASEFLKFLGDEKPLLGGSPFQINWQYSGDRGFELRDGHAKRCDDADYKCACSDCVESCPTLPTFDGYGSRCNVRGIPCLLVALALVMVVVAATGAAWHWYKRRLSLPSPPEPFLKAQRLLTRLQHSVSEAGSSLTLRIEAGFEKVGRLCATAPLQTLAMALIVVAILSSGLRYLTLETDPVNLWVSPSEQAFLEKQYFESTFGKFFRVEQLIISNNDTQPVLNWDVLQWWFAKEKQLVELGGGLLPLCFKPLGDSCAIESFTQYFDGNIDNLSADNWQKKLQGCTDSPVSCLPSFQQPLKRDLLFSVEQNGTQSYDSRAFVVTLLLENTEATADAAQTYEMLLLAWIDSIAPEAQRLGVLIAYLTEYSLGEELNKSTNTDVRIIAISYVIMFLYASFALGNRPRHDARWREVFVGTRFQLGLGGITIILLSVAASAGVFSFFEVKSTLIIAEVIPFLVLAVGIDNIFLIVHQLQIVNAVDAAPVEDRVARTMKTVGPSCLMSALLQFAMFLLATNVAMPAVKNFALFSAGAIFINFVLQMTAFVSMLAIDQKRIEGGKMDVLWIRVGAIRLGDPHEPRESWLTRFISTKYAPAILAPHRRKMVLAVFVAWFAISLSLSPTITFGLDQRIALPNGSYLIDYFNAVYSYLNVGPPVFFVVKDLDVTERSNQQKLCGKFSTCDEFSVSNILQQEYKRGGASTVAEPASVWLDDFLAWLNPDLDQCCRFKKSTLDQERPQFCSVFTPERQCQTCYEGHSPPYSIDMKSFPEGADFMFYFNEWIEEPSDPCPLGGKAPYSGSIAVNDTNIAASYFRTGHSPLRSQEDFIAAYQNAKRIVSEIGRFQPDLDVFAYSPFYVFFVQYDTIVRLTSVLLAGAGAIIFVVSGFLLGSVKLAAVVLVCVLMVMVDILGVMALWSISLNAVSLVNLVICVGLAVEFTVHLTKAFARGDKDDDAPARALYALKTTGASIFTGITMTKVIGITILAFTKSEIFEIYYFRMWASLVFIAAVHGLCLLPIMLSYV